MAVSIEAKHLLAAALFACGLLVGWFIWGASPNGRYQRVPDTGLVFDTKTGNYIDASTGRTLLELAEERTGRAARLAIWNIVKETPRGEISNERVRQELEKRGHKIPGDFDVHFNRAMRWVVVNNWVPEHHAPSRQ